MGVYFVGTRDSILGEPLFWVETHPILWREPKINLAELAKLRWIDGLPIKDIAIRHNKTVGAIKNRFREIRRIDLKDLDLNDLERRKIRRAID